MKRSIGYRFRFYLTIVLLIALVIVVGKRFAVPLASAVAEYKENGKTLERLRSIDTGSQSFDMLIDHKKKTMGVTQESPEALRMELFVGLEGVTSLFNIDVEEVFSSEEIHLKPYDLGINKILFSGDYPELLRTIQELELSLPNYRLTSVHIFKKRSKKKLYAEVVLQSLRDPSPVVGNEL